MVTVSGSVITWCARDRPGLHPVGLPLRATGAAWACQGLPGPWPL